MLPETPAQDTGADTRRTDDKDWLQAGGFLGTSGVMESTFHSSVAAAGAASRRKERKRWLTIPLHSSVNMRGDCRLWAATNRFNHASSSFAAVLFACLFHGHHAFVYCHAADRALPGILFQGSRHETRSASRSGRPLPLWPGVQRISDGQSTRRRGRRHITFRGFEESLSRKRDRANLATPHEVKILEHSSGFAFCPEPNMLRKPRLAPSLKEWYREVLGRHFRLVDEWRVCRSARIESFSRFKFSGIDDLDALPERGGNS